MPHTTPRASTRAPFLLSIAGLLLVPGATLAQSPSPSIDPTCTPGVVGSLDHPTGCTDIVLRMDVGGGFTALEVALTETPVFTLYGDNTVVFRPQPADGMWPGPGQAQTPLVRAVMSPEQVDALLTFALGPGGLSSVPDQLINPLIADAPTTVFTIDAAGVTRQVSAQALGFEDPQAPDKDARAQLSQLSDLLDSFEEQVQAGNVLSADLYQPAAYRGMLTEVWEGNTDPVTPWPWTDVALEDFVHPQDNIARYAELTPDQVAAVTQVPSGGITNIRTDAPDGSQWFLSVRPLLPDESFLPPGLDA